MYTLHGMNVQCASIRTLMQILQGEQACGVSAVQCLLVMPESHMLENGRCKASPCQSFSSCLPCRGILGEGPSSRHHLLPAKLLCQSPQLHQAFRWMQGCSFMLDITAAEKHTQAASGLLLACKPLLRAKWLALFHSTCTDSCCTCSNTYHDFTEAFMEQHENRHKCSVKAHSTLHKMCAP